MKSRNSFITNLLILIVGVAFIFMQGRANVITAIVTILGILFIAAGVVNLVLIMASKRSGSGSRVATIVASTAALVLGIWMASSPAALVHVIVFIFAGLLIAGSAYHIYKLAIGYAPLKFPRWMYVFPLLMFMGGVAILIMGPEQVMSYIVLITGIAMVVFALGSFIEMVGNNSYLKTKRHQEEIERLTEQ